MARKIIRVGTSPNDGTGDSLRETANKVNFNFAELYTAIGLDGCGNYSLNISPVSGNNVSITTSGVGSISLQSTSGVTVNSGTNNDLTINGRSMVVNSMLTLTGITNEQRDSLQATNGALVYNSEASRFQGYVNGVWVDLH